MNAMSKSSNHATESPNMQPMTTPRKRYSSIAQMVRDLSDDKSQGDRTARQIEARNIIDYLMALRTARKMSQTDIAEKMNCTQSKISKLESGRDNNLTIGDFHAYASALGLDMMIFLGKKDATMVEQVRSHAKEIGRLLNRLAELAGDDSYIANGVMSVIKSVAKMLEGMIQTAVNQIENAARQVTLPKEGPPLVLAVDGATTTPSESTNGCAAGRS